jgi:hypothetical protein
METTMCITVFNVLVSKEVVVDTNNIEIYSVVQGDIEKTNRLCHKKYFSSLNLYISL